MPRGRERFLMSAPKPLAAPHTLSTKGTEEGMTPGLRVTLVRVMVPPEMASLKFGSTKSFSASFSFPAMNLASIAARRARKAAPDPDQNFGFV